MSTSSTDSPSSMPAFVPTDVGDTPTFNPLEAVPEDTHQQGVDTSPALLEPPPKLGHVNFHYPQRSSPVHAPQEDSSYVSISRQRFQLRELAAAVPLNFASPDVP